MHLSPYSVVQHRVSASEKEMTMLSFHMQLLRTGISSWEVAHPLCILSCPLWKERHAQTSSGGQKPGVLLIGVSVLGFAPAK